MRVTDEEVVTPDKTIEIHDGHAAELFVAVEALDRAEETLDKKGPQLSLCVLALPRQSSKEIEDLAAQLKSRALTSTILKATPLPVRLARSRDLKAHNSSAKRRRRLCRRCCVF